MALVFSGCAQHKTASMKQTVYVYSDAGAGKDSLEQTFCTLRALVPDGYNVESIDAQGIKEGSWRREAALLVMPGGADLPYVKKLQGVGNQQIKQYVHQGGAYLGLCAGAYYGCHEVVFDKDGPLEVVGTRELAFFSKKAVGPILAPYDYRNNSGARVAWIRVDLPDFPTSLPFFYNGGPGFEEAQNTPGVRILGTYAQNEIPAILYIPCGKGRVILSGVHFEYDPEKLDPKDPYFKVLIPTLQKHQTQRKAFVKRLLGLLIE